MPDLALDYGDHRGRIELRETLASYLGRVRGVRVEPGRMVITQGFSQALDLLCRTLAARGARRIAMENPSLANLWLTVRSWGIELVGVPMDGDGPRLDVLDRLDPDAFVVSPAHQYPSGQVMAADRRSALVDWARRRDRLIVEDDYDAENRYDRMPIGALQGLDPEHVIHVGTASKVLAPALRLGWMSLPAELVAPVVAAKHLANSGSPSIDQLALDRLITSGDYERQVARLRQEYRGRRDRLIEVLARELPGREPRGVAAGVHLLLPLPDHGGRRGDRGSGRTAIDQRAPPVTVVHGRRRARDDARAGPAAGLRPPAGHPHRRGGDGAGRGRPLDDRGRRRPLTRAATGPQPARARFDADGRPPRAYPAAMMGKRHSDTTATLPDVRPTAVPGAATTAQQEGSAMIHPSDADLSRPLAVRDGQGAPVTCAACGCRLSRSGRCLVPLQPDRGPRRARLPDRVRRCGPRPERSPGLDRGLIRRRAGRQRPRVVVRAPRGRGLRPARGRPPTTIR